MEFLAVLWLPILLSAVLVFVVSAVFHMVLPFHKGEYQKLPGEDGILEQMRKETIVPGEYAFPGVSSMKEMGTPEMVKKYEQGPVGYLTIIPTGVPGMGKNLVAWFVYSIVISIFAGYLAMHTVGRGAEYLAVFRVTGTVAVIGYGVTHIPDSIWKGRPWSSTIKHVIDGVIYGLLTSGVFGWLWPDM